MTASAPTRRDWLRMSGGALAALAVGGCGDNWLGLSIEPSDSFDDVLARIHTTSPTFSIGLANHGPMVMETLVTLGREDRVARWASRYVRQLEVMPQAEPLADAERSGALGDSDRQPDWVATYSADVLAMSPADLLRREWSTLAPGWMATHGVIRVAHALRSLERADTPSRRLELAHGLGHWAGTFNRLPGEPGAQPIAGLDIVAALDAVPLVPEARRSDAKLIVERLAPLRSEPAFIAAIEAVDLDAVPVEQAVHDLVAASARIYVADGTNNIGLLHNITGTAALSLLLPYVEPDAQRMGLAYAFQCVAAIQATHGSKAGVPASVPATSLSAETLAARAALRSEEHEVKLSEACLREYAVEPRPELLAAAALIQS